MRARNMQSLTDDVKREYPGVVVYGVGDELHKLHASDHNEDDTTGSKAAQSDKDTTKEHRAVDIMLGPAFTKANGDALVAYLLKHHKDRLYGLIWHGSQWWRSTGFKEEPRTTDRHDDHVHVSGLAADDENAAPWLDGGVDMTEMFPRYGEQGDGVAYLQFQLENLGYDVGAVDSDYGNGTAAALAKFVKAYNGEVTDGKRLIPRYKIYVEAAWSRKFGASQPGPVGPRGPAGPAGPKGDKGDKGDPGTLPATVRLAGTAIISAE